MKALSLRRPPGAAALPSCLGPHQIWRFTRSPISFACAGPAPTLSGFLPVSSRSWFGGDSYDQRPAHPAQAVSAPQRVSQEQKRTKIRSSQMRSSKFAHSAGWADRGEAGFWCRGLHINLLHDRVTSLYGRVLKVREIHHYEDENSGEQDNVADRPRPGWQLVFSIKESW